MSFSSDTGLGECLVISRKTDEDFVGEPIRFASLRHRPQGFAESAAVAAGIVDASGIRGIEDGPYGGTQVMVGNNVAGEMLTAPQSDDGENWGSVRLHDYALAQTAHALDTIETVVARSSLLPSTCQLPLWAASANLV